MIMMMTMVMIMIMIMLIMMMTMIINKTAAPKNIKRPPTFHATR